MRAVPHTLARAAFILVAILVALPTFAQPVPLPPQEPGYLGLVVEARSGGTGLKVIELAPGGPAEQGGLQVNDLINMVGTTAINSPNDLGAALTGMTVGSNVQIRFVRSGVEGAAQVTLGSLPAQGPPQAGRLPQAPGLLGGTPVPSLPANATDDGILLGVTTVVPQLRDLLRIKAPGQFTRGAFVKEVFPGTPAANAGLQVDDLIYAIDGRSVASPTELIRRIKQAGAGGSVAVSYFSQGKQQKVDIQLAGPRAAGKPPVGQLPPAGPADAATDARLGELERRMTMLEQRLVDMQRSIDALRQRQP